MKERFYQPPGDTSPEALQVQIDILRKIGAEGRMRMAFELSDNLRRLTEEGIRQRHPEYSEKQVIQAVLSLQLEPVMMDEIFPDGWVRA